MRRAGGHLQDGQSYPLTFGQEQLLVVESLADPGILVFPSRLPIRSEVSVPNIATALSKVVRLHDALRMSSTATGQPGQLVSAHRPVEPLPSGADPHAYGVMVAATDTGRSPLFFSVDQKPAPPMLTVYLHHAFLDGWSAALVASDFYRHYDALSGTERFVLPVPAESFGCYASDLRAGMTGPRLRRHMSHWMAELAGAEPLALPYLARPWTPGARFGRFPALVFEVAAHSVAQVQAAAHRLNGSVSAAVLAAFAATVGGATGQRDLLVQAAMADRGTHRRRRLVGCLVNVVSLRLRLPSDLAAPATVVACRSALTSAARHQVGPFQRDGRRTGPGQVLNTSPRVTVTFNQEINIRADATLVSRSTPARVRRTDYGTVWESASNCIDDLHLEVLPGPPQLPLRFKLTYHPDYWNNDSIETLGLKMARWLIRLVRSV